MSKRLIPTSIQLPTDFSVDKNPITNQPYGFTISISMELQSSGDMSTYFDENQNLKIDKITDHILTGKLKIKGYKV